MLTSPECGFDPEITKFALSPISMPNGFTFDQLVSFDQARLAFKVQEQTDFTLIDEIAQVQVELETTEGLKIYAALIVSYQPNGPWLEDYTAQVPDITCSNEDKEWIFVFP